MYSVSTPAFVKPFARNFLWDVSTEKMEVFLTFDDGPTPGVTENVLIQLGKYSAQATFFCLGKNVISYPELFQQILASGHAVGNHSYSHPNGWRTGNYAYMRDVLKCNNAFESPWFRPPYGRITRGQALRLKKKFQIVMWSILSGDFDQEISKEKCLSNVLDNVKPGSIVVFHDSIKASEKLLYVLPEILETLSKNGFTFSCLPQPKKQE